MRFLSYLLLVLCCLSGTGAFAQLQKPRLEWTHNGEITALTRQYFRTSPGESPRQVELTTLQTLTAKYGACWQARGAARAILNDRHEHRRRVFLNEAYLAYRKNAWYLKAGKQTVKWGKLSGWSALDLANRYDYYDFLATEDEQLGMWGLRTRFTKGGTVVALSVFPGQAPSRLALTDNRWVNLPRALPHPAQPEVMLPLRQTELARSRTQKVPQIGWNLSTELGRFTWRVAGYYGQNDIPQTGIQLNAITATEASYTLELQYHPILINSLNVSTYLGSWNLWLEAAGVRSQRRAAGAAALSDDPYGFLSVGVDHLWMFDNPERQLKLLVQYVHSISPEERNYAAAELDHIFRKSTIVDFDLRLNYRWAFALRGVSDWATAGHYLRPGVEYKVHDNFQITFNADFLLGKPEGFFGLFQDNSRLVIFCKYYLL